MPRKHLDIRLTDYPFVRGRSKSFFPCLPGEGRVWAEPAKIKSPSKKAGANVSIILGHFKNG